MPCFMATNAAPKTDIYTVDLGNTYTRAVFTWITSYDLQEATSYNLQDALSLYDQ